MPHIHDDVDFCSEVMIVHEGKVLLRKHDKYDIWLGVGGHIEHGEDPVEAAIREAKEEVGLDVEIVDPRMPEHVTSRTRVLPAPMYMHRHKVNDKHEHVVFIYFATSDTEKLTLSTTEVASGCRWVSTQELEAMDIKPIIKFYAKKAIETITSRQALPSS